MHKRSYGRRLLDALMLAITLCRVACLIGTPGALLVAAIQWAGPRSAWPIFPTWAALGLAAAYAASSLLFFGIWTVELKARKQVVE